MSRSLFQHLSSFCYDMSWREMRLAGHLLYISTSSLYIVILLALSYIPNGNSFPLLCSSEYDTCPKVQQRLDINSPLKYSIVQNWGPLCFSTMFYLEHIIPFHFKNYCSFLRFSFFFFIIAFHLEKCFFCEKFLFLYFLKWFMVETGWDREG